MLKMLNEDIKNARKTEEEQEKRKIPTLEDLLGRVKGKHKQDIEKLYSQELGKKDKKEFSSQERNFLEHLLKIYDRYFEKNEEEHIKSYHGLHVKQMEYTEKLAAKQNELETVRSNKAMVQQIVKDTKQELSSLKAKVGMEKTEEIKMTIK